MKAPVRFLALISSVLLFWLGGCQSDAFGPLPPIAEKEPAPWGHEDWQYRRTVSVYQSEIQTEEDLRDFSLLLSLNERQHADVFAGARADGADLLVTDGDGQTVLKREVVHYDPAAKTAEIWFRTPVLSRATTRYYLYYGNPDTVISMNPAESWSEEFRAVYHFSDDPGLGTLTDSSPRGAHIELSPELNWTSADVTEGQIHQGWLFNGTTHYLTSPAISTQDSSYVISAWLLHTTRSVDFFFHAQPDFWHLSSQRWAPEPVPDYVAPSEGALWEPRPIAINDGYHHFAWVFNGVADFVEFYYDGVRQQFRVGSASVYTGRLINPQETEPVGIVGPIYPIVDDFFDGSADEFRLREGIIPPGWIETEYRNQKNQSEYFRFGAQETREAPVP